MLNAQNSKCWTCLHGICLQESEQEEISGIPIEDDGDQQKYPFAIDDQDEENEEEEGSAIIERARVKAICFWRPEGLQSPPILVGQVKECSRYDQRTNNL